VLEKQWGSNFQWNSEFTKDEIIKILIQNDLKLLDVSTKKDWVCISAQKASDPI